MSIAVGVIGASGYTGLELLRLVAGHPDMELAAISSRQYENQSLGEIVPGLPPALHNLRFQAPDMRHFSGCQAVFFATPSGVAAQYAPALLQKGIRVFDLSADFRLRDAAQWQHWYGAAHPHPQWLREAIYGLPELWKLAQVAEVADEQLAKARLVAVPGCYPTAVLLATAPLLHAGLLQTPLLADCMSGVSGAGREANTQLLYGEIAENFRAYKVSGHRHLAEMLQQLGQVAQRPVATGELIFVPHLVPMKRGIFATVHAAVDGAAKGEDAVAAVRACWQAAYASAAFVQIAAEGEEIATAQVRHSNYCRLAVHSPTGAADRVILQAVIDNLGKGAAGQAVQCFNLLFGLTETAGLLAPAA